MYDMRNHIIYRVLVRNVFLEIEFFFYRIYKIRREVIYSKNKQFTIFLLAQL